MFKSVLLNRGKSYLDKSSRYYSRIAKFLSQHKIGILSTPSVLFP